MGEIGHLLLTPLLGTNSSSLWVSTNPQAQGASQVLLQGPQLQEDTSGAELYCTEPVVGSG